MTDASVTRTHTKDLTDVRRPVLVLWDVDHTLIENAGVSKEVYAETYRRYTGTLPTVRPQTDGRTDPQIMAELFEANGSVLEEEQRVSLFANLTDVMDGLAEKLHEEGQALPGAAESLAALASLSNVIQSALTGNIQPNAVKKLDVFGLTRWLDLEVGGYGSDDIVRSHLVSVAQNRARQKYGHDFDRSSTVLLGDTIRDVEAGQNGGAFVVAVATGINTETELKDAGANVVLSNLEDVQAVTTAVLQVLE